MQKILTASRYLPAAAFLGYTAFANAVFLQKTDGLALGDIGSLLRGAAAAQLDSLYKESLPHRQASIGLMGAARYLAMGDGRKGVVVGQQNWLFTEEETRSMSWPMADAVAPIRAVRQKLAAQGIELVLVPVPAKLDLARDQSPDDKLSQAVGQRYDLFLAELAAQGIPAIDSRAALAPVDGHGFFATDTHWTPQGAAAVAQAVARSGLVKTGSIQFQVTQEPARSFAGDLVSYVTTETFAPLVGLAPESVQPYLASDPNAALDLFADAGAGSVALVGTSYSANPDWSFAEALKLSLRRDVLNHAEQGQGPVKPMMALLQSPDLQDAPPQVILWEFPVRYLAEPTLWDGAMDMTVASNER